MSNKRITNNVKIYDNITSDTVNFNKINFKEFMSYHFIYFI